MLGNEDARYLANKDDGNENDLNDVWQETSGQNCQPFF